MPRDLLNLIYSYAAASWVDLTVLASVSRQWRLTALRTHPSHRITLTVADADVIVSSLIHGRCEHAVCHRIMVLPHLSRHPLRHHIIRIALTQPGYVSIPHFALSELSLLRHFSRLESLTCHYLNRDQAELLNFRIQGHACIHWIHVVLTLTLRPCVSICFATTCSFFPSVSLLHVSRCS